MKILRSTGKRTFALKNFNNLDIRLARPVNWFIDKYLPESGFGASLRLPFFRELNHSSGLLFTEEQCTFLKN
jgi:hypothetical protein